MEVESTLLRHPAVHEAAVVGFSDEKSGEAPHAFVVFRAGVQASPAELRAFCRDHLGRTSRRRAASTAVDDLPKTATGKIQKYVLRKGRPNIATQSSNPRELFTMPRRTEAAGTPCRPCLGGPASAAHPYTGAPTFCGDSRARPPTRPPTQCEGRHRLPMIRLAWPTSFGRKDFELIGAARTSSMSAICAW